MRTNRGFVGDEEKEVRVLKRAVDREREKYGEGGSSEDVWEGRRRVVRGAFEGDWGFVEEMSRGRGGGGDGEERG